MYNEHEIPDDVSVFCISSPLFIVLYGYRNNDNCVNPNLTAIMDVLNVYIDAEKIEDLFLNQKPGEGDLWVFGDHRSSCMVFSLYRDPADQMDVITFGIICRNEYRSRLYDLMIAMKEETQKKLQFAEYDVSEKPDWLHAVISGEDHYITGQYEQKIRYAKSK